MPVTRIKVTKKGNFNLGRKKEIVEMKVLTGMRQMLEDIHRTSRPTTPMKTGDLRSDVRKNTSKIGNTVRGEIEWQRPYAWYQERGYGNGGQFRNYTTPGTGPHFAATAVKVVTAKSRKYFSKKI